MSNGFNYAYLKKDNTMYLSTISKQDINAKQPYYRQSTFLQNDISGTKPRNFIPQYSVSANYSLSTHIEPYPDRYKHINKKSDSLFIGDIEGATPKSSQFRTNRIVNPLSPIYTLPSVSQIIADKGRNFIRDTLKVDDINCKRKNTYENKRERMITQPIEGAKPFRHFKEVKNISRLQVKDINKGDAFESRRHPNPLCPLYFWRDNQQKRLNNSYGTIQGSYPHHENSNQISKPNLCLSITDIQGTQANSFLAKSHFLDKRRQFRNYMTTKDIEKADASSLQKGIVTKRQTNPLMPNYQFPGHLQLH